MTIAQRNSRQNKINWRERAQEMGQTNKGKGQTQLQQQQIKGDES